MEWEVMEDSCCIVSSYQLNPLRRPRRASEAFGNRPVSSVDTVFDPKPFCLPRSASDAFGKRDVASVDAAATSNSDCRPRRLGERLSERPFRPLVPRAARRAAITSS